MKYPLAAYINCKGVCVLYDILFDEKVIGHAEVKKEGLYYRFSCACTPPDSGIYKVIVSDGDNRQDLGVCVPDGTQFICNSRVACKYLHQESLRFTLVSKKDTKSVPVATGEPFTYLEQLETAHLHTAGGQAEVIIDPVQDQRDSDQIQESLHE